jgi:hypothetical protein
MRWVIVTLSICGAMGTFLLLSALLQVIGK